MLLGTGPFVACVLSRSIGIPGDQGDIGNWGYWVGAVSLFVEAALVVVSISMLPALRQAVTRGPRRDAAGRIHRQVSPQAPAGGVLRHVQRIRARPAAAV